MRTPAHVWMMVLLLGGGLVWAEKPSHQHYQSSPHTDQPGADGSLAPRLQQLGSHTFPVTTRSPRAQLFINQGLNLAYGFNHAEARRAFREAARLDPDCAMAYWGQALVLGPNINAPMNPADEPVALGLLQQALAREKNASPRERAYIHALAQRYSGKPKDRADRDQAYAKAMRQVHELFPDDLDAAALYVEALMDLRPWNYWTRDGQPRPGTEQIRQTLEQVMARNPDHPGALHFWIHLMEPTDQAERAVAAADRLQQLVPGAGHLVHMPSHIYVRVGRYADAVAANHRAIAADEGYLTQCRVQGFYPVSYYPHNIHFLWYAETMRGRAEEAIAAARKTAEKLTVEVLKEAPALQFFVATPYHALVRFGRWDQMLAEPRPAYDGPLVMGLWHFGRGLAHSAKGQYQQAQTELAKLRELAEDPAIQKLTLWTPNAVGQVLAIGVAELEGDIAAREGDFAKAIPLLDKAVRLEDGLSYIEPPDWGLPTRHVLGAVLLQAGRAAEAEVVFWEDLRRNKNSGWALQGLLQALRAQDKQEEAQAVETRLHQAWPDREM